ncbi:MAG: hypothetical protein N2Z85_01270 [Patescibacteria group bacterium]|nr:hypothetical protein [Patescibacteria group bacterium]
MKFEKINNFNNDQNKEGESKKNIKKIAFKKFQELKSSPEIQKYIKRIEKIAKVFFISCILTINSLIIKKGIEEKEQYLKYNQSHYSEVDKQNIRSMEEEIAKKAGLEIVDNIKKRDFEIFIENKDKKINENLEFNGFNELGIDANILKELWSDKNGSYPKNWISKNIKKINYINQNKDILDKENNKLIAAASSSINNIDFYKLKHYENLSKKDLLYNLDMFFSHEIGHHNDWHNSPNINLLERLEIFSKILNRLNGESKLISFDNAFNLSKKEYYELKGNDINTQTGEYFAEVCRNYFNFPGWLKQVFPEDFDLIDKYIKKTDPDFDPFKAVNQRLKIIDQVE